MRPTISLVGLGAPVAVTLVALLALAFSNPLHAQDTTRVAPAPDPAGGWNAPGTLALVDRARSRRREPVADEALRSYRAEVTGHIYFFIDREDDPEPVLLRADQVALDLYWAQPDRVKQVVRGMRSEEQFPIRDFRYYVDRYTVIQNGFEDVIRVGEGRDVRNVIHPLAPEGRWMYDFRLGDSTTIRLPGQPDPIRVFEIQVRPRDFDVPGIVGSLFVEMTRGDLVRLAFTFTPASYLDRRNERVEIVLENALWEGRYWLPREQRLLVRREIPELDLDVGTVIRGALRVVDYEFNVDLPESFFRGREVVMAAGPERLAEYDFPVGLYEGLAAVGLEGAEPGTLAAVDVDAITGRILRDRFLRGVPRLRFYAPTASDVLRFGRTEGLVTGAGAAFGVGSSQTYVHAAWAWGSRDLLARVGWRPAGPDASPRTLGEGYLNQPRHVGLRPATAGIISSLSAAFLGRDYRDVAVVSGATVGRRWGDNSSGRTTLSATVERLDPGEQALSHAPGDEGRWFRPVAPIASGTQAQMAWQREARRAIGPVMASWRPRVEGGHLWADHDTGVFLRVRLHAEGRWAAPGRESGVEGRITTGLALGAVAPHHMWYLGGPGSLPGHPFHAYAGSAAGVADLTAWRTIVPRWVRLRAFGAVGWAGGDEPPRPISILPGVDPSQLEPWSPGPSEEVQGSIGAGIGLLYGVLRLDYALRTDSWDGTFILSLDPDLWSFL